MMNTDYAHNGFFISAELDLDGKPTGRVLVISSDGQVVHVADSFEEAVKWIDDQTDEPPPPGGTKPKM